MRYPTTRPGLLVLICILFFSAGATGASTDGAADLIERADELFGKGDYEQALQLIDGAIERSGETVELLEYKDDLLWKMNRHEDRIENVLRLEEIAERKSPWYCLKLSEAYLQLGQNDEAIRWLEIAVGERGFRRVAVFQSEVFDPIRDDDQFQAVISKANENMGIGKPVPDITVTLLDGRELTLSSLKRKVTLLDFWASWCVPCRREIPNLKLLYGEFNTRGFEIVGINLDDDKVNASAYIEANNLDWPMSWSERGWQDEPAQLYKVNGLPSMWLIDKNGILRYFNVKGDELRKGIQLLLSEADH